jgi:hypothetical protein
MGAGKIKFGHLGKTKDLAAAHHGNKDGTAMETMTGT